MKERQTYMVGEREPNAREAEAGKKEDKERGQKKIESLFWNVHRKVGRGKKSCGEWIPSIRSIFGFESDPSERVYPVKPIIGTRPIPQICLATGRRVDTWIDLDGTLHCNYESGPANGHSPWAPGTQYLDTPGNGCVLASRLSIVL